MNPRVCWFCRIALFTIQSCFTENSSFCIIFRSSLSVGDSDVQILKSIIKDDQFVQGGVCSLWRSFLQISFIAWHLSLQEFLSFGLMRY